MFLMKISFNFTRYGQRASSTIKLFNYIKLARNPSFIIRCCSDSEALEKYTVSQSCAQENFEKEYFRKVMSDKSKYPSCNFSGDPSVTNQNSTNGLVLTLRNLVHGNGSSEVNSTQDMPPIENFNADVFTLDDFVEIFYLMSIPDVRSKVTYANKDFITFLSNVCKPHSSTVDQELSKHLILVHLLRQTGFHRSYVAYRSVYRIYKSCKSLSNAQIVEFFYFLQFYKKTISLKEAKYVTEKKLASKLPGLTLDEVAVIAYGFFRSENHPSKHFCRAVCNRIEDEVPNWNNLQASVFSKFINFCGSVTNSETVGRIMDKCVPIMDKFSLISLIHLSCLGINYNVEKPELLEPVIERTIREIATVRLKDIERLFLACLYANIHLSEDSEFVKIVVESLKTKKDEINDFQRAFWSLLQYLVMYGIYLEDYINDALSNETLEKIPFVSKRRKLHELLFLDVSTEIERPNYKGNKLPMLLRKKIAVTHSVIINSVRDNSSYKSTLAIAYGLESIYGEGKCKVKRLLPHYATYHPVLCFNQNNEVQCMDKVLEEPAGTTVWPPKDGNKWLCFMYGRPYNFLSDGITPNLVTEAKLRQFKAVGYTPIMVRSIDWIKNNDGDLRNSYLRELVESTLKSGGDSGV